jgi:hypothetical protein
MVFVKVCFLIKTESRQVWENIWKVKHMARKKTASKNKVKLKNNKIRCGKCGRGRNEIWDE